MAELKYAKNIITETKPLTPEMVQKRAGSPVKSTRLLWLDDEVAEGAFYTECVWLWSKSGTDAYATEVAHAHDFDEVIGFVGTNPEDPRDLGGEIELWLDDEQYILKNSCLIFIPRGLKHCPLAFRRIDRPIFFFTEGNGTMYKRTSEDKS